MLRLVQMLGEKLVTYAPREVFTNDLVLDAGFAAALHHLDLVNVRHAAAGVVARPALVDSLEAEQGLTPAGRQAFLLLADLKAHLDLAMETASFFRRDHGDLAGVLDAVLSQGVFPHLLPQVGPAYAALCDVYGTLQPEMGPEAMGDFAGQAVAVLRDALAPAGIKLNAAITLLPS